MTSLYCNEGPQGEAWADVMARLQHAILPEINADSTFFTVAQVRTLVAGIKALESTLSGAVEGIVELRNERAEMHGSVIPSWQDEVERLLAEVADLKSREVIEHGSIHYPPLAATNGTWEWLDASDGLQMYLGRDTLPHDLYALLPGVNLDKFAMAYPTRDAAMDALRASIAATRGGA